MIRNIYCEEKGLGNPNKEGKKGSKLKDRKRSRKRWEANIAFSKRYNEIIMRLSVKGRGLVTVPIGRLKIPRQFDKIADSKS